VKKGRVTKEFVANWSPRYDETEDDEPEYRELVQLVNADARMGAVSEQTFIRIIAWKATRLLGNGWIGRRLKTEGYSHSYGETIAKVLRQKADSGMILLEGEKGIKTPVASTIMHFLHPTKFPIMDFRTVAVLQSMGYINWEGCSSRNYTEFKDVLLRISRDIGCSLREIDRAMFAHDKQNRQSHSKT
jgi:hypothetical protein